VCFIKYYEVDVEILKTVLDRYRKYLNEEKAASRNTVDSYLRDINLLCTSMKKINLETFDELTADDFSLIMAALAHEGRSEASLERFLSSVKGFYRFLVYDGICKKSPVGDYTVKRSKKKSPEVLTEVEVSRLLAQPDINTFKGLRDRAMMELMYATALPVSDLTALDVGDVNVFAGTVISHDARRRVISVYPSAAAVLSEYINLYTKLYGTLDLRTPLFINQQSQRLTRQGIWKIVKEYTTTARITKDVSPHTLRQSFAAHLADKGASSDELMEVMGYSQVSTARALMSR